MTRDSLSPSRESRDKGVTNLRLWFEQAKKKKLQNI